MADADVLLDACEEAGLNRAAAVEILESDAFGKDVDSSHSSWSGIRKVSGIPVIVFKVYHPHLDLHHKEHRFNGSVALTNYEDAFRDIELYASQAPKWRLDPPTSKTYEVVFAPAVAVRERPTTESAVLRWHRPNVELAAYGVLDGKWMKPRYESGWILLKSDTYGVLIEPKST